MKNTNIIMAVLFGLTVLSGSGLRPNTPSPPMNPTAAAKPEIVPSRSVLNSRNATLQVETRVLNGVTPSSIIFADRPVRAAGHHTADVIAEWASGEEASPKEPAERNGLRPGQGRFGQGCGGCTEKSEA
ncbi:hypothetical protein [Bradyrhizobium sp. JYMT SZCCT0180]|uniref:hypothetical protein n=1 Tax=Bradyrhizobium sp. JYMT SZCCT0180 TaxID=2807666 RepID=UPI0020125870|nr:hypothetical protein [Bradyrhizobium sp. JYMT SZCCT0180]